MAREPRRNGAPASQSARGSTKYTNMNKKHILEQGINIHRRHEAPTCDTPQSLSKYRRARAPPGTGARKAMSGPALSQNCTMTKGLRSGGENIVKSSNSRYIDQCSTRVVICMSERTRAVQRKRASVWQARDSGIHYSLTRPRIR